MDDNTRFAEQLELDYPILSDPLQGVARAYGVVDDQRRVPRRWTFIIGADGTILHIDKAVKSGRHGEDIAAKLAELQIPRASPQ